MDKRKYRINVIDSATGNLAEMAGGEPMSFETNSAVLFLDAQEAGGRSVILQSLDVTPAWSDTARCADFIYGAFLLLSALMPTDHEEKLDIMAAIGAGIVALYVNQVGLKSAAGLLATLAEDVARRAVEGGA